MTDFETVYASNHRRQMGLLIGFSALALLCTAASRQERALFITDGSGLKAFGAGLSTPTFGDFVRLPADFFSDTGPSAFFARTPPRPNGPFGTPGAPAGSGIEPAPTGSGGGFAPAESPVAPGAGTASNFSPDSGVPGGGSPGGSNFPFSPPTLNAPTASPVVPNPTVNPVDTTPVVPAVPEPATWVMLIAGFVTAGFALRRNRQTAADLASPANHGI